jgi:hypothetical protein
MKRLLLLIPALVVLVGCGTGKDSPRPLLSHGASIDDTPLRLDVAGLHRVGEIVALDLRLANRAPRGGDPYEIDGTFAAEGGYDDDVGGVLMLDPKTGRQTSPLGADQVNLGMVEVAPGGTQLVRAVFPAPRGKTVDVLVPHFGLFRDVPVK